MKSRLSRIRRRVLRDKWLLLTCLTLAFFSWQGIRKNIGFEVSVSDITVDIDVPEKWAVWEKSVPRVNIIFRGSREDIRYLNKEQLRVVIPVPDPEQGEERVIKLSSAFLRNPTGAKVVRFSPSEIVVKLDQEDERLLSVKPATSGNLPDGLEIDRIVCSPASVRITGARQALDNMEFVRTEAVVLDDRQGPFKTSVPLALPEAGRMRANPDWVSVELFLETRKSTRTFEKIPIRTMCAPGELRQIQVQPQSLNITVRGQQQRINELKPEDLFAYVGCYDLPESTGYELTVVVDLPPGLQLVKTDPTSVYVEIGNVK